MLPLNDNKNFENKLTKETKVRVLKRFTSSVEGNPIAQRELFLNSIVKEGLEEAYLAIEDI